VGCCAFALLSAGAARADEKLSPEQLQFFERKVRPVLAERCYRCHGEDAKKRRGGLRLDSREAVLRGGDSGPAVVPGRPEKSLLVQAVRHTHPELRMPPDKKLSSTQVADLEAWVKMGAPDPRGMAARAAPEGIDRERAKRFWSFQPVRDPAPPAVKERAWPANPIDRFLLARLEERGMRPAPEANRRTLIRRVTFDLTGLPPTPAEIDAFLTDRSPEAWNKVIDRLLSSPHYGERWGRHWLDVARYADTSGCNSDFPLPDVWRYRNYVIDAFNKDTPFDQFVREQVAGDLLPASSTAQRHEQLIATGFLALSRRFGSLDDENHLTVEDSIDTVGKAFLGLSLSCARCHDHKFDPVSNRDYYALYGILDSSRYAYPGTEVFRWRRDMVPLVSSLEEESTIWQDMDAEHDLDIKIKKLWRVKQDTDPGAEKNRLQQEYDRLVRQREELVKKAANHAKAYGVLDGDGKNARVHKKGDPEKLGEEVPRGFLTILGGQRVPTGEKGSGRLQLAEWLTDRSNPLTARVMVNRIWLHHFGRGLVATPNDFGARGSPPSHPELLDWLASRFMEGGWSVKAMHRLILQSRAYRMACVENERYVETDPGNALLWRFNRRRLSAEEVRDSMLAVSGGLDRTPGGPHPFPPEQGWRYTQHNPYLAVYDTNRRAVYLMQQRIKKQPFLEVFDGADPNVTTGQRPLSNTPLQALFLMNSPFAHAQSARFAGRLLAAPGTTEQRIDLAHRLALGRPASHEETEAGAAYLRQCEEKLGGAAAPEARRLDAWASYLRVLYSSNEFVFVD
jgi:hypothetical protein